MNFRKLLFYYRNRACFLLDYSPCEICLEADEG